MVGGWARGRSWGKCIKGGTLDLGKHVKGEVLRMEYMKEYFTGGSASKGRWFGRSLAKG